MATQTVPVPESLLKAKKTAEERRAAALVSKQFTIKKNKLARRDAYKKAEKYEQEYKDAERALIRNRRLSRAGGTSFFVEPEAKRVHTQGINGVSPKVRKVLQLLRLRQVHNATFLRVNKATMNMLKLVEPYVTYGEPSLKTVRSLVYKRGHGKIDGQRIPLVDNHIIAKSLGHLGVTCMEDIIHEIFTCGPNFKTVNRFLWTFKLSSPRGGFVRKSTGFAEGGDAGNREKYINKLVKQMN